MMTMKISFITIICIAICTILFADQEVNNVVVTVDMIEAPSGGWSDTTVVFVAPGYGKYQIAFDFVYNIDIGPHVLINFGIEGILPHFAINYYPDEWENGIPQTYRVWVDLEEGIEYTLYASIWNAGVIVSDPVLTATHKFIYERDFMVSLPFNEYFENKGDNVTFNPLMTYESGSYFDFTGYAWADAKFDINWFHPNFQMDFQGTINDIVTIYPPFNTDDLIEHIYFQETYHPYYNPHPFFQDCSNTVEYLGDFEMIDNEGDEAYFGDRIFNFEYAPNYANLTSIEFTIESSDDCHPLLEWSTRYSLFFYYNGLHNYFETVIKRRKYNIMGNPIENWNVIATISPTDYTYEDLTLESPDPDPEPGGTFGIEGTAKYKIMLQQTPANPNYNASWADQVCGESSIRSILYGQNGGGGEQNPMLYGVFNLNIVDFHNPTISFTIKDDAYANTSVKIYNIRGQLVQTLLDEALSKGRHTLVWNGTDMNNRNVASGVYLMRICRGNEKTARKISLLR
ncbi:T9SS C-terminal target domain-containing protein [bacterium]|nr:MAG: T9SS C-terminal target domain-containing protein [bacterium]